MKGGFSAEELGVENLGKITQTLQAALKTENGTIGFGEYQKPIREL